MDVCPFCGAMISAPLVECPECAARIGDAPSEVPASGLRRPSTYDPMTVVVGIAGVAMLIFTLLPPVGAQHGSASVEQCRQNLKRIGAALHLYHDRYGSFPPAYVTNEAGQPLYGWRVLILPFLGEEELYRRFDRTAAWNAPQNRYVLEHMPDVFRCPSCEQSARPKVVYTHYAGVVGPRSAFEGTRPVHSLEVVDGLSRTLMVIESAEASIPWTSPRDIDAAQGFRINALDGASSPHTGGAFGLTVDEGVHFLDEDLPSSVIRTYAARDDGDGLDVNESR